MTVRPFDYRGWRLGYLRTNAKAAEAMREPRLARRLRSELSAAEREERRKSLIPQMEEGDEPAR